MLHGSAKSALGVFAIGCFGLPSGDLWPLCGMPVFVGDWKRVQSQSSCNSQMLRHKYCWIASFPFRCWRVGETCQRPSNTSHFSSNSLPPFGSDPRCARLLRTGS